MTENNDEPYERVWNYCIFHDLPLPCPICIGEQRAMQAEFNRMASQPGAVIKSLVQVEPRKWIEQVWKVLDDGSRLLMSERPYKPEELDANR